MKWKKHAILLLLALNYLKCDCANILGIVPAASYSHQLAYMNLWNELSLKGHKVSVLTTDPQNNPNLTEIDLSLGYKLLEEHSWSQKNIEGNSLDYLHFLSQCLCDGVDLYLNLPEVQNLINNKTLHFDVVMVESLFAEFLVFGELFEAPTILLASYEAPVFKHKNFQNDYHHILYPDSMLPYFDATSFMGRLKIFAIQWIMQNIRAQYVPLRQNTIDKYFGNKSLPIDQLLAKSSMFFVSASPVLLYPRALSARTVIIGGGITIKPAKILDKKVKKFLDAATSGAIYFSLGSNAKSEILGNATLNGIIKVLQQLPYKVLWKFNNTNNIYKMPGNILTLPWFEQQDILRHPNIKLFITQGGMQSLEEAIYFEKPMIGIPMFADQEANLKKLEPKGVLKLVQSKPLQPSKLKEAILEVMGDVGYLEQIRFLNKVNLDQPMSGLEKAVWWTEYVIRHRGNVEHMIHHFAKEISWYQYYMLDVILVLGASIVFLISILYFLVKFIVKRLIIGINNRTIIKKGV
ncbi:unnamed protein product [Ceutorhynchus assimilis]|uniref:UDP-glucuronosyltransferase n=1 Tax=Ceutorhynchus assimilis TaxID=467358 RepID=A0A9N9MQS3_9CUCU|nr:unnamed protein product [Ceutorhynchus assimilis]